jgi:hypothetical protein
MGLEHINTQDATSVSSVCSNLYNIQLMKSEAERYLNINWVIVIIVTVM